MNYELRMKVKNNTTYEAYGHFTGYTRHIISIFDSMILYYLLPILRIGFCSKSRFTRVNKIISYTYTQSQLITFAIHSLASLGILDVT